MSRQVIEEYVAIIGFEIDEQSLNEVGRKLSEFKESAHGIAKGFAETPAVKQLNQRLKQIPELIEHAAQKVGKNVGNALKGVIEAISGFVGEIIGLLGPEGLLVASIVAGVAAVVTAVMAAIAALTAAITAATGVFMLKMAAADMEVQKLSKRLLTTVDNARSLKTAMDAMGLKSLEDLKDVNLNPELRKQFLELRALSASLGPSKDAEEGYKNIRAITYEFQKLRVLATYTLVEIGGLLGKYLAGPLKDLKAALEDFGQTFKVNLRDVASLIAFGLAFTVQLVAWIIKLVAWMGKVGAFMVPIKAAFGPIAMGFGLLVKSILPFYALLTGITKAGAGLKGLFSGHGLSAFSVDLKHGDGPMAKAAEYLRKINDMISSVIRPLKIVLDWVVAKVLDLYFGLKNAIGALVHAGAQVGAKAGQFASDTWQTYTGALGKPVSAATRYGNAAVAPGVKLSSGNSLPFVQAWGPTAPVGTVVTSGQGPGHAAGVHSHANGWKFDVGLSGKKPEYAAALYKSLLNQPGFDVMHLEYSPAFYQRTMSILQQQGVDTSKMGKDWSGVRHSGPNADIQTHPVVNQHVTINIDNKDPHATAKEVHKVLGQMSSTQMRGLQGVSA